MIYVNNMTIKGLKNEESVLRVLEKLIPKATILGGVLIGIFSVLTDMLGAVIPGTSMFMVLGIIFNYYEQLSEGKDLNSKLKQIL